MPTPTVPVDPFPFLTGAEFTARVPASQNVSTQAPFHQCLRNAMTLHLKPLLTEELYNDLMAAYKTFVEPPKTPMSVEYQALLKYVQDALAWQTYYLFLRHNYAPMRETGSANLQGQGVQIIDKAELSRKEQEALQYMQAYECAARDFLNKYASSYPLWQTGTQSAAPVSHNGMTVIDVKAKSLTHRRR